MIWIYWSRSIWKNFGHFMTLQFHYVDMTEARIFSGHLCVSLTGLKRARHPCGRLVDVFSQRASLVWTHVDVDHYYSRAFHSERLIFLIICFKCMHMNAFFFFFRIVFPMNNLIHVCFKCFFIFFECFSHIAFSSSWTHLFQLITLCLSIISTNITQ